MVVFLVDPTIRVPSATDITAQQEDGLGIADTPSLSVDPGAQPFRRTMTREEAEDYRLELMEERSVFVDESNSADCGYFGTVSSSSRSVTISAYGFDLGIFHVVRCFADVLRKTLSRNPPVSTNIGRPPVRVNSPS